MDLNKFPWQLFPRDMPVAVDMSSNIGTTEVPWDKLGVVYMGSQKNLGTAGCTVICVREDLLGKAQEDVPILCDWTTHEKSPDTYYNTPAIWPMFVTGLNVSYQNQMGGLQHYIQLANQRSRLMWDAIEQSNGYFQTKISDS